MTAVLAGGAALCGECIAKKTGIPVDHIEPVMVRVGRTLRLQVTGGRCDACLAVRTVYRMT